MNAPKNPKRNHHHVWQAYLKPWASDNLIWCSEQGDLPSQKHTRKVAMDRDFYQLHPLNKSDLDALEWLIRQGSPRLQKLNRSFVNLALTEIRIYEKISSPTEAMRQTMLKISYEKLEDFHSSIENSFAPLLARLREGDAGFYHDVNEIITFIRYICTQFTRTKAFKQKTLMRISTLESPVDFSRIWNLLIHIFAYNIGEGLYLERKRRILQILRNDSLVPFITSDQPVFNLKGSEDGTAGMAFAFYYPFSPNRALYWGDVDEAPIDEVVTEKNARAFNSKMRSAAYLQIFAKEKSHLLL